ncbi:M20 metallopeptidase family protein [Cetobacterium sp.]|uniref:M20 metallopeptidase family protein n=1 Tax=Cetobacterium sp. TaxID=2071632 RepID=UPI003EE796B8
MNRFNLNDEINIIIDELKEYRNKLHKEPELSMKEYKTTEFLYKKLKLFGVDEVIKVEKTGVIATIYGKDKKKGIALRADIDALPITEETEFLNKSIIQGVSHACGHDMHTIILLGVAKILNKYKDTLPKSIRLIFQPAEETGEGAKYMIENGCLDNITLEAILALHCWPDQPTGKIFSRSGKVCASSDKFRIVITGVQGHAAHPHKTIDPIVIAGNIICAVQTIISREISPLESNVITFGTINGGTKENIISKEVEMTGTIRSLNPDIREYIHKRLEEVVIKTAEVYRGTAKVFITKGLPPLVNDIEITEIVKNSIIEFLGEDCYEYNPDSSMGGEDFSYYLERIPGSMFRIGCGFENEKNYPLHSNKFNPNDDAIITGIKALIIPTLRLLGE